MKKEEILKDFIQSNIQKDASIFDILKAWLLYLLIGYVLILDYPYLKSADNIFWTIGISILMLLLIITIRKINNKKHSYVESLDDIKLFMLQRVFLRILAAIVFSIILILVLRINFLNQNSPSNIIKIIIYPFLIQMIYPLESASTIIFDTLSEKYKNQKVLKKLKKQSIFSDNLDSLKHFFLNIKKLKLKMEQKYFIFQ